MKIVVIGGSGLIGGKLVDTLRERGHEAVPASPASGVDSVTGKGLPEVLAGARVVVDVTNSPSFEDTAVLEFFRASTGNLLAAEVAAGVGHHVALSIVGADRLPDSGYLRAKVAQEELVKGGPVPYTIVRATQFFEFIPSIARAGADGDTFRLSPALLQPVAADDVVDALADATVGPPVGGTVEVAGPDRVGLDELVRRLLLAGRLEGDAAQVTTDPEAHYFGTRLDDGSLTAGDGALLGRTRYADWLEASAPTR
ncbi:SDR family oxidoreductase [Polymorphospora sp. NPDC050346]|uniref:SDR family oxidoreductase n=1 Tax=Polymorphospora sp. NPDC050346 TaxID=3155780 RepID=UPI0033E17EFA